MLPTPIEAALANAEHCFQDVASALVSGEPVALESASAALRQSAMVLSGGLQRLSPLDLKNAGLKLRLKRLADGMAVQRESLIRRTVLVDRALNSIIPAASRSTYGQAAGPYGSLGKQTGAFKYLAA